MRCLTKHVIEAETYNNEHLKNFSAQVKKEFNLLAQDENILKEATFSPQFGLSRILALLSYLTNIVARKTKTDQFNSLFSACQILILSKEHVSADILKTELIN